MVHPPLALVVVVTLAGALVMLTWRAREARRAVTIRSIVIPPLGMSTGLSMFLAPATRVPASWALAAFALGALVFSIPLTTTSRLVRDGAKVVVQRSRAFVVILLVLVGVRFALREWIEQYVSPLQTGALFFLLAFGAVVRWRLEMLQEYQRLVSEPQPPGGRDAGALV